MKLFGILLGAITGITTAQELGGPASPASQATTYLNLVRVGNKVTAQFDNSFKLLLDNPYVRPAPNRDSFEYWGFDAVNPNNINESVVVMFYLAHNLSLPHRTTASLVSVDVWLNFGDGTSAPVVMDAQPDFRGIATVTIAPLMILGDWDSTGAAFTGTISAMDGRSLYEINIDNPEAGLRGTLRLQSEGPPHLPCTSNLTKTDASLEAISHVGWTNEVPDADAVATFSLNSSLTGNVEKTLQFTGGFGYHDHLFGDVPLRKSVKDWYSGHARFGPYSVVWLKIISWDGKGQFNFQLSRNGRDLFTTCSKFNSSSATLPTDGDWKIVNDWYEADKVGMEIQTVELDRVSAMTFNIYKTKLVASNKEMSAWTGNVVTVTETEVTYRGAGMLMQHHFERPE
ncbi:hypothetical protein BDV95DRAFT_607091 [Massariosphaeria phaeospora]|uniref:Uncharacterized protein n=1 Tax=Massariosphaeria phaeospora TaxID=100035 RepID=A0A7C8IAU4_9PLEO|nr:hypothetical protein BDV95DRAFT_607091 [Massariosphaeria phaeospora]